MIQIQDLNFSIKNVSLLQHINLQIEAGKFIAIVGPNGAGKSTLLNLLANEIPSKETQKIKLKDKVLSEWDIKELAFHKAKFSQQHSNDLPLLVEDVVLMGRYPYFDAKPEKEDIEKVQKQMEIADILDLRKRDYTTLSGGEKQRVHLARALVQLENETEKKILFLDEPLNNLDVKHQYLTLRIIKNFTAKGNTATVVMHDLNLTAQFADKVIIMKGGEIISFNQPQEVFKEDIISTVYNFPCKVCQNPLTENLLILFG